MRRRLFLLSKQQNESCVNENLAVDDAHVNTGGYVVVETSSSCLEQGLEYTPLEAGSVSSDSAFIFFQVEGEAAVTMNDSVTFSSGTGTATHAIHGCSGL